MSAVTIEHSELLNVHDSPVSEETKEFIGEQSFVHTEVGGVLSRSNNSSETDCKYKQNNKKDTTVRSVVIGDDEDDDDEDSSDVANTVNTQENIDPYKDYDTFLYDHDYTGMFRPANIPKIVEEGYDSMVFPVMPGLSSHFADDDFEEQQNSGSRNLGYSAETLSPLYRFRDFSSRQNDGTVDKGHGIHPTTSYRLSTSPILYGGKTVMRYSSMGGPQGYRATRDAFVAPPSLSRTIANYGTTRRINFSSGNLPQRKTIRTRFGERPYEQPGLRIMPSPTKQYAESLAPLQSSAASFVADPMRAANDNAPAPFIVPARGSRPSLRGKGQASRAQQAKGKITDSEEKQQSDHTEYKVVCGLPQKNENVLQVVSMVGEHPGRIYEPQLDMASSNRNYISKTVLGPAHASHSDFTYNRFYQQSGGVDTNLNLPTTSTIQHSRQSVGTVGEDTENIRAESPVTSIVESAHREAINRASESAHGNDSAAQVKVLTQPTGQCLQQLRYSVSENDQNYEGGQRSRFHSYVQYDQPMMEYYNDGSQEQCSPGVTSASVEQQQQQHNYFADEEQRPSIDERYFPIQAAQRRRFSSRSSSCSSYNENSMRTTDALHGRVRHGRQVTVLSSGPRDSGLIRQVPSQLTNRMVDSFVHSDEKHMQRDAHVMLQSPAAGNVSGGTTTAAVNLQQQQQQQQQLQSQSQKQQRIQQLPSTVSGAVITRTSESVTTQNEQFSDQQPLQHTQLSSPEQQLPVTTQQYIPSMLGESISNNVDLEVQHNYNYISTEAGRPNGYRQHLAHQAFINEETSSGDELAMNNSTQIQTYDERRIQELNMRSSVSAAEEETSFAEDQSEERGTEEEEQRTQKGAIEQVNKLNEYDGWSEGDEYTTRCYCTMSHNDDFMIQCDVCNVWQHMVCVSVDKSRVPKVYKCEKCNPRLLKLSVAEAKAIQMKYLETKKRKKLGKQKMRKLEQGTRKKIISRTKEKKTVSDGNSKKFLETNFNDYSRTVAALAKKQPDTGNIAILDAVKSNETVRVMYVAQDCEGLVSTRSFRKGEPVVLVCGRICMQSECPGREKPGSIMPFVMLYSIYIGGQDPESINICIDARRAGSTARFARRSCRPNVELQHMFSGGKLYVFGVAVEDIERGDEVTLPFDPDYALANRKLVCACSPEEESLTSNTCKIRKMINTVEDNSVSQKDTGKRVNGTKRSSGRMNIRNKKSRIDKEGESQIISGDEALEESQNHLTAKQTSFNESEIGRKISMSSVGQVSSISGGLTATDEEFVLADEDSTVSSKSKNEVSNEHASVKTVAKSKEKAKKPNATVRAASQKKKDEIKLKRRTKRSSLRNKDISKNGEANEEVVEQSFKYDFNRKSENTTISTTVDTAATAAVSGVAIIPKKRSHLSSDAVLQSVQAKTINEKANISSPKMVDEIKTTTVSQGNMVAINSVGDQNDASVKVEVKEEVGTETCNNFEFSPVKVSEGKKVVEVECKKKSDNEEQKKEAMKVETGITGNESNGNGVALKRKSAGNVDKDIDIVEKKFKEDDDVKSSDLESSGTRKRDKQVNVTGTKKSMHHRRELPEVEMMNYMLPGDRNKPETREERKMKQQLALFERMQRESKRKEEKRLQKAENLMSVKSMPVVGKKQLEKGTNDEVERSNVKKAVDLNSESKNVQTNSNFPARRSARVSERGQLIKDASGEGMMDTNNDKKGSLDTTHTLPSSQHPSFLNAPRKRWAAAAARSSSLENSAVPTATQQAPNTVQKSYLLRNAEPATAKDSAEIIRSDSAVALRDESKKSEEISSIVPIKKAKESIVSAASDTNQKKVECESNAATKSKSVKTECFSDPAVALSKISEASKELAACYAQICAMTSDLGIVDFKLPAKGFNKRESSLKNRLCKEVVSTSGLSTSSKSQANSPKKPQKKKMSLDEYKKRKETSSVSSEDKSEENATSSKSFIPTIKDNDLEAVSKRALLKLGSIPDPAQLRDAPTASLDDLKRRIYGKPSSSTPSRSLRMTNQPRGRTPPETNETNLNPPISSQSKCSSSSPAPLIVPTKLKVEQKEPRLPLEERLQMLLGGTDPSLLTSNSQTLRPLPPPPPPPPPPLTSQAPIHTRGINSRKVEATTLHTVRGRTPPPPPPPPSLYNSGLMCRPRRH